MSTIEVKGRCVECDADALFLDDATGMVLCHECVARDESADATDPDPVMVTCPACDEDALSLTGARPVGDATVERTYRCRSCGETGAQVVEVLS